MSHLKGKVVAILGGTGTLGRALVRVIAAHYADVREVRIFSRDEIKQLEMMEDFPEQDFSYLKYMLGDVRDRERLGEILDGVDIVIHAAAIKHVVMAEKNPGECHKTNVIGTQNVLEACLHCGVHLAVLISTDKAVDPIGVYGRSKKEAEKRWLASAKAQTQFRIVRLGNVVDARGSVFEIFKKQRKSGVLKVTHPEATRYYISQENAAKFILTNTQKNDQPLSVPHMKQFRVMDLAREIAPECKIEIIGLRPGDKLHEQISESEVADNPATS